MATEPNFALLNNGATRARADCAERRQESIADYWALTKPEVNFLILIATFAGFYLAPTPAAAGFQTLFMICTLGGTLLVASGTGALNQKQLVRGADGVQKKYGRAADPALAA